jgi:hypothetical protein
LNENNIYHREWSRGLAPPSGGQVIQTLPYALGIAAQTKGLLAMATGKSLGG